MAFIVVEVVCPRIIPPVNQAFVRSFLLLGEVGATQRRRHAL
jgi:hypothetical protein